MDLTRALTLNNKAIMLVSEHRDQEAVIALTQALTQLKGALGSSSVNGTLGGVSRLHECAVHHSTFTLPDFQDSTCYIYNNALFFSLPSSSDFLPSDEDVNVYTSTIILNIALLYHRKGRTGNSSCLRKAEKMYEMIGKLLTNDANIQGTALLVKVAATNNLSQLRYERGDYNSSCDGFKYLGSLMNYAGDNLHKAKCEDHVYKGMLLNAMMLISSPDAAAAA